MKPGHVSESVPAITTATEKSVIHSLLVCFSFHNFLVPYSLFYWSLPFRIPSFLLWFIYLFYFLTFFPYIYFYQFVSVYFKITVVRVLMKTQRANSWLHFTFKKLRNGRDFWHLLLLPRHLLGGAGKIRKRFDQCTWVQAHEQRDSLNCESKQLMSIKYPLRDCTQLVRQSQFRLIYIQYNLHFPQTHPFSQKQFITRNIKHYTCLRGNPNASLTPPSAREPPLWNHCISALSTMSSVAFWLHFNVLNSTKEKVHKDLYSG